jgi:hypothetical protein
VALTLRTIINAITPGQPVDLSSLPQPLTTPLALLNPFTGANYNGTPCGAAPGPAFSTPGGFTLFAHNTNCRDLGRSLYLSDNEFYLMNSVHSNASLRITGDNGLVWYDVTYRCNLTGNGRNNIFGSGPTQSAAILPTPVSFNPAAVSCTVSINGSLNLNNSGPWWVGGNSSSRLLNPGVYCATGNITLTRDDVTGSVTLVAGGRVDINADSVTLRALHPSGVLAYAGSGSLSAIDVDGRNNSFAGYLFVPDGRADVAGDDFTLNGAIIAERIRLAGRRVAIVSTTP